MMRIAIAGAGGFAQILAQQISQTAHALLVISRRVESPSAPSILAPWGNGPLTILQPHPELEEYCPGCQVAVVDYADVEDLRYTLRGVDLLISTIAGNEQLNLIDAARKARVGVFVPSEFEGDLSHRPANDPLDRGSHSALDLLERWSHSKSHNMRYTVFSCGLFMERFGPGGMQTYQMGAGCGIQGPDDYLVNIQEARAEIVPLNSSGRPVQVSLTSVYDVARFITSAIELGLENWPKEFRMRGDSMTVQELVRTCSNVRGGWLSPMTPLLTPFARSWLTARSPSHSPFQRYQPSLPGRRSTGRSLPAVWGLGTVVLLPEAPADGQWEVSRPPSQPQRRREPERGDPGAAHAVQHLVGEGLGACGVI